RTGRGPRRDHRPRVGRESRSVHERPRGAGAAVAPQDRRRLRREAHSHAPRRRLPPRHVTRKAAAQPASLPRSLSRLRLRLTAWYVGTFFAILALLGIGMFATITKRFDDDLDASLRDATREIVDAVRRRDAKPGGAA